MFFGLDLGAFTPFLHMLRDRERILDIFEITSATTLLALLAIYFFGGEILKGFSLAMILGVVFGTYSSIYIANTVLVRLRVSQKTVLREDDQNKLN